MDPLSGAASVIAVVSLTFQVLGSVDNVRRFFRGVANAPRELGRIVESLDQLHCLLNDVAQALSRYQRLNGTPEAPQSLYQSLDICKERMDTLQQVIEKSGAVCGNSKTAPRYWASLKLTLRKKDIAEYERQLSQAVAALQAALSACLYSLTIQYEFPHINMKRCGS